MKAGIILVCILAAGLYGFTRPGKRKQQRPPAVTLKFEYDSAAYKPDGDTIAFTPSRKLIWQDFKAPAPESGRAVANSAVGFKFSAGIETRNQSDITITVKACAYFVKSSSWVKTSRASEYILKHEQLHFDIARLGLDKFRQLLSAATLNRNNYNAVITNAYRQAWREYLDMQELYDIQTGHSINKNEQELWNRKVAAQLQALP